MLLPVQERGNKKRKPKRRNKDYYSAFLYFIAPCNDGFAGFYNRENITLFHINSLGS